MLKHFALTAVTGFLALFGTNEGLPFPRTVITKSHQQPGEVLPLNGQLLTTTTPDLPDTTAPVPTPAGELYGVEVTGGGEAARRKANEAARTEIPSRVQTWLCSGLTAAVVASGRVLTSSTCPK